MAENNTVSKSTMYIAIAISLLVGFLSGVVYYVYNAPTNMQTAVGADTVTSKIASLEQEAEQQPDNVIVWTNLGHAYFDSDQFAKAIVAYNKSLKLHPDNADVLTDLGVMYRRNSQPDKAIETFDRAIKINPQHEQSRFNKGVVLLYDLQNPAEAIKVWEELVRVNPGAVGPAGAPLTDLIKEVKEQASATK